MTELGIWLLSAVLLGAAVLVAHAALYWAVVRAEGSSGRDRLLGLVPPFLPFVAWKLGLRFLPVVWALLIVAYLVLRAMR